MVRVFLKGGVWKNSEDEILKAAVQKYGKQQWARVASLLNRKSAKQAKARWYEWLDPSIRKTEWSSQEEEKLLHLAKLMPAQWKTIASTIGRTATQCQEHYEYLLDQAATETTAGDVSGVSSAASTLLRAGQIDSHPESKPARPDPIDMDEDEMEMLQEARARLANTMGKKAKRKQRERTLQAAKRLADLQKRRELKQAGLISKAATKRSKLGRRNIDLGVEIPFHKPAPAGFHDVSAENHRSDVALAKQMKKIDYRSINEQQYRTRDREAAQIREKVESRLRILEDSNEKYRKQKDEMDQQPEQMFKRAPLQLPPPTITDHDYQQLAKLQQQQLQSSQMIFDQDTLGGNTATLALLSDYSDTSALLTIPPKQSTSRGSVASQQQLLMKEASHLRQLERGKTPLLIGQDNIEEESFQQNYNEHMDTKDDDSETYRKPAAKITTMSSTASVFSSKTNQTAKSSVIIRDRLGLNNKNSISGDEVASVGINLALKPLSNFSSTILDNDGISVGASTFATASKYSIRDLARQQRRAAKRARQELDAAFASLPAPQYEYELAAPALDKNEMEDIDEDTGLLESKRDRAEIEAAELESLRQEAKRQYEARNSVMKRLNELPRPPAHSVRSFQSITAPFPSDPSEINFSKSHDLVHEEMQALIQHDAHEFPLPMCNDNNKKTKKDKKKKRNHDKEISNDNDGVCEFALPPKIDLQQFQSDELDAARLLVKHELEQLLEDRANDAIMNGKASNHEDAREYLFMETIKATLNQNTLIYTRKNGWMERESCSDDELVSSLRLEVETLDEATAALKKKNDKIEGKLRLVTGGYSKVADKYVAEIQQAYENIQKLETELLIYRQLQEQEAVAGVHRIQSLKDDLSNLKQSHIEMQKRYGELALRYRRLSMKGAATSRTNATTDNMTPSVHLTSS